MAQAIQITRAGKMTETIHFKNPHALKKFVEAFAETETPPTEDHILSFIKKNPGAITVIYYRNKNGQLHDGQNGEAAVRRWDQNSQLRSEAHYQNNQIHDGAKGEAAWKEWDENGKLWYEAHFQNGKLSYIELYSKPAREYKTPEELAAYKVEMKTKALAAKLPSGMKFL